MDEKGAAVALITLFAFRPTTRASKNKATWACFGDRTAAVELAVRTMLSAGTPPAPTTILCYLDNQERPDHQTEACDSHVSELSAELRVVDGRAAQDKTFPGKLLFSRRIRRSDFDPRFVAHGRQRGHVAFYQCRPLTRF